MSSILFLSCRGGHVAGDLQGRFSLHSLPGTEKRPAGQDDQSGGLNNDGVEPAGESRQGRKRSKRGGLIGVTVLAVLALASPSWAAPGDLDPSFGSGGKVTTGFGGTYGGASAGAVQPDGKIVVVGGTGNSDEDLVFAIARYNPNGSLDSSFSGDGIQTADVGDGSTAGARGVAIQPDGKIVVAGWGGGSGKIVRYTPTGGLDTTFSGDGIATVSFSVWDVLIQPDGTIVAAGGTGDWPDSSIAIARLTSSGDLDTTFDGDGTQTVSFTDTWNLATTLALTSDGKVVVGGLSGADRGRWALVRLNTNGSLDTTFSDDGKVRTDFGGTFGGVDDIAIQPDGKIVGVGFGMTSLIARYSQDGSLDQSFGQGGSRSDSAQPSNAVALQPDGKIVAAGANSLSGFHVARHNTSGTLDSGFLSSGLGTIPFAGYSAYDVEIQDDGKIVVIGGEKSPFPGEGSDTEFGLVRLQGGEAPPAVPTPIGPGKPAPKPAKPAPPKMTAVRLKSKKITTKQRPVLNFRLSKAGHVNVKVLKVKAGVRKGKRCVKPSKQPSGKRCDLQVRTLKRSLKAGEQKLTLPKLQPGQYRVAVGIGGSSSRSLAIQVTRH